MLHGLIEKQEKGVFISVVNVEDWEQNEALKNQAVYDVGFYRSGKAIYFFWTEEDAMEFASNNDIIVLPTEEEFNLVFSICRDYNKK
jgi:hypothetical protein